ncbi:methyl-accepting chemotaxis protein [Halopseudomonas yangmingensis]|uniref:Methyl-accepting chemotaxis protein n=1 Tax=Halopseudomonas yangmingensis TaxID=1720063 RepID=A0A1I4U7U1_9GAMM|nr:methyl-accepting chemotaxis protein [Halopseudomonas yangmingensis]SFM85017.1 methyl-accepting chemotaxis protein [Halopseudomonas yangmingensis]
MAHILAPGIALLGRLRYRSKFVLVSLIFLVPLSVMAWQLLSGLNERIAFTERERGALVQLQQLRITLDKLQRHRGMSTALLAGQDSFAEPLRALRSELDADIDVLRSLPLHELPAAHAFLSGWPQLTAELPRLQSDQGFVRHTELITLIRELAMQMAAEEQLLLDPELESYYLIGLLVNDLPQLVEAMGQSRALGSSMLSRGSRDGEVLQRLGINRHVVEQGLGSFDRSLEQVFRHNPALREQLGDLGRQAAETVAEFNRLLGEQVIEAQGAISADQLFTASTAAIDQIYAVYDRTLPSVDTLLLQRLQQDKWLRNMIVLVMLAVLLGMLYLFAAFYQDVITTIARLQQLSERLGEGDLRSRCEVRSRDELADVAHSLNRMAADFENLIRNVVDSTAMVAAAAEELSTVTLETADGVARQRAETEQVVSAVTELSCAAREVAQNTLLAADSADQASQQAQHGQQLLGQALDKVNALATEMSGASRMIQDLASKSESIGSVMQVINGIAEQTGLLALNAAIEAARAGDSGRGFAVVADEVRALAGRTRISTEEIRQMIEALQGDTRVTVEVNQRGLAQSADTQQLVDSACESLVGILRMVAAINEMTVQIATASEEQTAVVEDINRSMLVIAESVERSAVASEQTAESSRGLSELAQQLMLMTNRFQLGG